MVELLEPAPLASWRPFIVLILSFQDFVRYSEGLKDSMQIESCKLLITLTQQIISILLGATFPDAGAASVVERWMIQFVDFSCECI